MSKLKEELRNYVRENWDKECWENPEDLDNHLFFSINQVLDFVTKKPSQKMKLCKGCYHKCMPNNKSGYCYRCQRGKYNVNTGRREGGMK